MPRGKPQAGCGPIHATMHCENDGLGESKAYVDSDALATPDIEDQRRPETSDHPPLCMTHAGIHNTG